jgi:hypothetical protein
VLKLDSYQQGLALLVFGDELPQPVGVLLDRVAATNCPPVSKLTFDLGFFALSGEPTPVDGVGIGYAPRRTVLDDMLVKAAVEAGAELREHFSVQEIMTDGERVTGIRGQTAGGGIYAHRFWSGCDTT